MTGFVIVALILAIVIPLAIAHSKKTNVAWSDAARTLGLSYRPSGFMQSRLINGQIHNLRVVVDTYKRGSGKNSTTYTRFRVSYPRSLGLGLKLNRERMLSSVTKFFGSQDIQIGDASFDKAMMVKGRNEHAIREFLTPARRLRIQRFVANRTNASVDDHAIHFSKTGVVSNSGEIISNLQIMTRLAVHLTENREDDSRLQQAMQLQNDGDPEQALRVIESTVQQVAAQSAGASKAEPSASFLDAPVEERMLRGELLYLGGQREKAHREFQSLQQADPDDQEIVEWISRTGTPKSDSHPANPPQAKPVTPDVSTGDPPAPEEAETAIEAKAFCDDLFGESAKSYDVNSTFEAKYQGREVEWSGELIKIERNYSSFIFEDSGGSKATFKIDERPSPYYGTQDVLAVVHLPESAQEQLRSRTGETMRFSGKLTKADGLMRNAYLDQGQLS